MRANRHQIEARFKSLYEGREKLIFGDPNQLNIIREYQEINKYCLKCDGEGTVICYCCEGTGENKGVKL